MHHPFTHFQHALHALAPTDRERAHKLGVSLRTIVEYRAGRLPRALFTLVHSTALADALARDAHHLRASPTLPPPAVPDEADEPPLPGSVHLPTTWLTTVDGLVLSTTITQQLRRVPQEHADAQVPWSADQAAGHPAASRSEADPNPSSLAAGAAPGVAGYDPA
jgi:hypothetical protein